ncbi:MAG: hypothetical protein ACI8PZ_003388 [Myxococcota bacterium]|jgi:hypothetical protein
MLSASEAHVQDPPSQFKSVAVMNLIAGVLNLSVGLGIAFTIWGVIGAVGGSCLALVTLGLCPIGFLVMFIPILLVPVALIELVVGIVGLAAPDSIKGVMRFVPFLQLPCVLLGDLVSPIVAVVSIMMLKDPQVKAYIQG